MLTESQVKTMFREKKLQRDWDEWKAKQAQREVNLIGYRRGWWYRSLGALRESCSNAAELAGWNASDEAHPAMVAVGVRVTA